MELQLHETHSAAVLLNAGEAGRRVVRSQKREDIRAQFVQEVADYIVTHQGPDEEGRAHPTVKRMQIEIIEGALSIACRSGVSAELRPYHIKGQLGVWKDERYLNEVLVKRIDQLLREKFKGDLFKLFTESTAIDLIRTPLTEIVGGRTLKVSMAHIGTIFGGNLFQMLERYREIKGITEYANLKTYHMRTASQGTYNDPVIVDEVLVKKVEQVLKDIFKGDRFSLFIEATQKDLLSPLIDYVVGQPVKVTMDSIRHKFSDSPFRILARYREIKADSEFSKLRPYHMSVAPMGTFDDPAVVDEVLVKKIDNLLQEKYGGDCLRLMTESTLDDISSPLVETIAGRPVTVSMDSVAKRFGYSPFRMLERYRELREVNGFSEFRPFHMKFASTGTFNDSAIVDEVLVKRIDRLLRDRYEGDLFRLITETTAGELFSSFLDTANGEPIEISMAAVQRRIPTAFQMLMRYLEVKEISGFSNFRCFHMLRASPGTFDDPVVVDEVLGKKIDQLLENKFGGNLFALLTQAALEDLLSPLTDTLADRPIEISMSRVVKKFGASPIRMFLQYLKIRNIGEYSDLRPFHMSKPSQGTFGDPAIVDELLVRKIDQLLKEHYQGDRFLLMAGTTYEELASPLIDHLAGNAIEVGMIQVGRIFNVSVHAMFRRYHRIKGLPFNASPECFIGSSETRARRLSGNFSDYDLKLMRTADGSFDTRKFGMRTFNSDGKRDVREFTIAVAMDTLGESQVRYLGLEDQHLESLRLTYQYLNLDLAASAIIERDPRTYAAMNSLRGALPNGEGEALSKVTILHDTLERGLSRINGTFNFINLDYLGHLAPAHLKTCEELLREKLSPLAVLSVTHQDTALARSRTENHGLGGRGARGMGDHLIELAGTEWTVSQIADLPYRGGTGKQETSMITQIFLLKREDASQIMDALR
jgi:hypothetical protein